MPVHDLAPVRRHLEADFDQAVARLSDLLRIPSVSTDPAYAGETRRAGQWVVDALRRLGFTADLRATPGHPIVVAHHPGPGGEGVPHILYYGHYDVQPPDPLDLWTSPPFEPAIVEGPRGPRVVARGAVDDKGQLLTFLEAFRGWHAVHGTLPVKVTVLVEGEEECGSPSLLPFLRANRDELKADVCVLSDTNSWDIDTPAVTTSLRGLLYVDLTLLGPARDLHSGMFGGAVLNPLNTLTRVLGQLHDAEGRIQIPGFYDDVRPPAPEQRAQWAALGFDERVWLSDIGLTAPLGEAGWTTLERVWARPTCDLNGLYGGYTAEGSKTVIPAKASAKLSCRLVPDQDPQKILAGLKQFLEARTPPDGRWEVTTHGASPGVRVPTGSPYLQAALAGLSEVYGRDAVLTGSGGSIPVVGMIQSVLGFDSLLVGFGLEDDRIHSPNEKFELRCFKNGIQSHAAILARLAALRPAAAS